MKDMQLEKPKVCPVTRADMQLRRKAVISEVSVEVACIYRSQKEYCVLSTDHQLSNIICLFEILQSFLMQSIGIVLWLTNVLAGSMLSSSYGPDIT